MERYYKVCFFSKEGRTGRIQYLSEDYTLEQIVTYQGEDGEELGDDLRFTLFQGDHKDPLTSVLLIDIDKANYDCLPSVLEFCAQELNVYGAYVVFTGGGFHVYIPLETAVSKEDMARYKVSYREKCKEWTEKYKLIFDSLAIHPPKYGRFPGSNNSKYGTEVKLVERFAGGENGRLLPIGELLEAREVVVDNSPPITEDNVEEATLKDSDVYKYCSFIKNCYDNQESTPHSQWIKGAGLMAAMGRMDWAHEISSKHSTYNQEEVEALGGKTYRYACSTIAEEFEGCKRCPFRYEKGHSPIEITGPLPTASRSRGFHKYIAPKKEDESGYVDMHKLEARDVANYFYNSQRDTCIVAQREADGQVTGSELRKYEDGKYDLRAPNLEFSAKAKAKIPEILKLIDTIPRNPHVPVAQYNAVLDELGKVAHHFKSVRKADMNPPHLVGFTNGVYNLKAHSFGPHSPDNLLTRILPFNYDPDTTYEDTYIKPFLAKTLYGQDDIELIQAFAGLMISNIPIAEYRSLLWLRGVSGSGKSSFIRNMGDMVSGKVGSINLFSLASDKPLNIPLDEMYFVFQDETGDPDKMNKWDMTRISEGIKRYTTGTYLRCYKKFSDEHAVISKAPLLVTSNFDPPIMQTGETDGVLSRVRRVSFNHIFTAEEKKAFKDWNGGNPLFMNSLLNFAFDGLRKGIERQEATGEYLPSFTQDERLFRGVLTGEFDDPSDVDYRDVDGRDNDFDLIGFLKANLVAIHPKDIVAESTGKKRRVPLNDLRKRIRNRCNEYNAVEPRKKDIVALVTTLMDRKFKGWRKSLPNDLYVRVGGSTVFNYLSFLDEYEGDVEDLRL